MKQYYKIADHIICIECDNPKVIESIQGFVEFRCEYKREYVMCVKLNSCNPIPIEGDRFHRVETPIAHCLLFHTLGGSGLEIKQNNVLKLSLLYDVYSKTCVINGCLIPELVRYALWIAFNYSVASLQTIAIHSSSIVYQNKAFLYLGGSGTGKSTHTRLLCQYLTGTELLNDDSPILRIMDGKCFVYGSPWSGKTACYKQKKAILAGITRLYQAPENALGQLSLHKSVAALLPSFPSELYLNYKQLHHVTDLISTILDSVEICSFKCQPNKEAAEISIEYIRSACI